MSPTAPWITLSFLLFGALHGHETEPPSLEDCCQNGRTRALDGQDCTILPFISFHTCSLAHELCCHSVQSDIFCDKGIKMARQQGPCEIPFFDGKGYEIQTAKRCCDCCTLGLRAAHWGLSCELHGLLLGKHCTSVAQSCCDKNTTEATERPQVVTTTEGPNGCTDSSCSQLQLGNCTCACYDGFKLHDDGKNCEDVNECLTGNHNCGYGQICINTEGSFRCQRGISCGTGYELTDNNSCKDIDECALGTHHCGPNLVCTNTQGSFRCHPRDKCPDGYIQDAVSGCIDINECLAHPSPCLAGQTCINTMGSYTCRSHTVSCGRGYHLTENGTRCEDVDECHTGDVCGHHSCVNVVGSYRCECQTGYTFNSFSRLCEDINECVQYLGRTCAHKCENTVGTFKCICATGFKLAQDGRSCEDVNECEAHPCSQECANVYGSYQCYCRRGYQLSDIDGLTCEDIDECTLPAGGKLCSYQCVNTPGSFNCTCPPGGFVLNHDGRTCQDVDECTAGTHTCSVFESCFNIQGGFRCLSFQCPENFQPAPRRSRGDVSGTLRCVKSCPPYDNNCPLSLIHFITYTAISLPAFRDLSEPEEIVFLRTAAPAQPVVAGAIDVVFDIVAADDHFSFDVAKRSQSGMIVGVIRQVKPIIGPKEVVLEVAMNYVKSGVVSYRNVVIIHVFICKFWF